MFPCQSMINIVFYSTAVTWTNSVLQKSMERCPYSTVPEEMHSNLKYTHGVRPNDQAVIFLFSVEFFKADWNRLTTEALADFSGKDSC